VDILEIDRSFVHRLRSDAGADAASASALAKTILSLAEALDLDTVAEGVEECEQRDTLLALGCQIGQGYWYGRPMPIRDLLGTPAVHRRGVLADNLQGPVDFSPTGRFRIIRPPAASA
jgi:EAL domain-containing protein (putative c-di-GMP-specific phosphodiesterase class I)